MRRMDNRSSLARRVAGLAGVGLVSLSLGGCLGYDGEVTRGYVADQRSLEQVKSGSSAEQVLVLLGTPSTTSTVGGTAWYYISQTVDHTFAFSAPAVVDQRVLAVYFNKDKKVGAHRQLRAAGRQDLRLHQPGRRPRAAPSRAS